MANTVLESQNSFQTTDHLHIQNQYTNTPVQHWSSRPTDGNKYSSKYLQATFSPALPDCHCKRIFSPGIQLVTVIQSARLGPQRFIREYLTEKRSILRIFSIRQVINEFIYEDDFPAGIWLYR
jgi:hypothetical protein